MANRNFDSGYVLGKQRVILQGSFQPNNTSAPTLVKGKGFSVARTGVGVYVITFQDKFVDYDNASADLAFASATGNWAQVQAVDAAGGTMTIQLVNNAGAGVDVVGATNSRVHFSITMVNTTIP